MKTSQNVLNMSTVSRDTNRDGDATDWWLQQQSDGETFCIRLTVFVSVLQDVIKINVLGKGYTSFVGSATAVVSSLDSGTSPPNFIQFYKS